MVSTGASTWSRTETVVNTNWSVYTELCPWVAWESVFVWYSFVGGGGWVCGVVWGEREGVTGILIVV